MATVQGKGQCCFMYATKPEVIENKVFEGTDCLKAALSSGMTSLQVMVACKKCGLGEQLSTDIAVSWTLVKPSDIQSENIRFKTLWFTPLTRLSIHTAHNSLLPLLFLRSVSILSGCHIISICGYYQNRKLSWIGRMAYHPRSGFHYYKLLTYLCHGYNSCSKFQAWI